MKKIVLFTCLAILSFAGCEKASDWGSEFPDEIEFDSRILGTWESKPYENQSQVVLDFKEDRTARRTAYSKKPRYDNYRYYYFHVPFSSGKLYLRFVDEEGGGGYGLPITFYDGDSIRLDKIYYKVK
jgi:hypothetical protein